MQLTIEDFEKCCIPEPNSGCWLWSRACSVGGYGMYLSLYAHRVAYELYIGPIPEGMNVCHKCDIPPCVNPEHLFVGTHADNMEDMYRKGRRKRKNVLDSAYSTQVRVEKPLWLQFRAGCLAHGFTVSAMLRRMIERKLREWKGDVLWPTGGKD